MTLTLNYLFYLLGVVLVVVASMIYVDKTNPRRLTAGTFWLVYALIFLIGDWLPANVVGVLVVIMALIAGFGGVTAGKPKMLSEETRRLADALSWAAVLPQMLGMMLGLVFSDADVGKAVAHVTTAYVNLDYRLVAVAVYCVGMALFTMVMGNGFAAFPVMTGGVGVPILVGVFHGNPATMVAIIMLRGYCGTLMTPMAANFNMVPAALLELPDKNAVIKVQIPTALSLLVMNTFLLNWLMFL
ncbi:MAG: FIG001614: Membrane protein [uncultured Caballeronia sp.]|nr:MAG: FIG001614: Membrane protein [uncultured Caballeronia sp.]